MLQRCIELVERDAVAQEVEQCAGVDAAGAGSHRDALEWRESHRRIDGAAVAHRSDRAAAAEVADDEPGRGHLLGRPRDGQAVEAIAANAARAEGLR